MPININAIRNLLLVLLTALPGVGHSDDDHAWGAHYLANAGVMIARGDTKVLFDPFFRNGFGVYDVVPDDIEAALFEGTPPWDGIDAIFISHYHGDHFEPAVVLDFLRRWGDVEVYAPEQAVDALMEVNAEDLDGMRARVHAISLARDSEALSFETPDLLIEAVRVAHAGWPRRHAEVENIVFRVTLDETATVMHLGDADSANEHYIPHASHWRERDSDLALVPVWLMLTDKGRHVIDTHIDAQHEIGMHVYKSVPDDPDDREPKFDGLDLFTEPGETRDWNGVDQ